MADKKTTALTQGRVPRDPFALLRQMTSELDKAFEQPFGAFRWPSIRAAAWREPAGWTPEIDVFERDNRLVTKVDLPGVEKDNLKVEVADGCLSISGHRKGEAEETKDHFYRCERSYGSFYHAVPLPEGTKIEEVKATFADGVLEVSVPLPVKAQVKPRAVTIEEGVKPAAGAAA